MKKNWLSKFELEHVLKCFIKYFSHVNYLGTFYCNADISVDSGSDKCHIAILNTANSNQHGQHWVSLVIKGDLLIYFDSLGKPPTTCMTQSKLFQHKKLVIVNDRKLQQRDGICGKYVLCFIYLYLLGVLEAPEILKVRNLLDNFNHFMKDDFVERFYTTYISI